MNRSSHRNDRIRRRIRGVAALTAVLSLTIPAPAAHAGLLGSTLGLVTETVDTTVDSVTGLVVGENGLLSGWLYDDSSTSLSHVNEVVGAPKLWRNGITGDGVDVAVLDTGAVPLTGLNRSPVVNGPDLSFESQSPQQQ